ncbi:MAG: radical SAM protein [Patescibacteria group bacterium]
MTQKNIKKEKNQFIYKFEKEDVNKKLGKIFGPRFQKYREDFDKTQRYMETNFIPDFPLMISMEFVNRCNLNCVMCYKEHHFKPKAELSLEVIDKVLEESKKHEMPSITLGLGSEILLFKDMNKVIEMVAEAGIMDVFFATNAALLNDKIIKSLVDNKISRFRVSIDAATEETYNKVRRVPVLKNVEANINKLIDYRNKTKSLLPVVRLSYVIMDINKHETEQFINKWKDKVDYIDFQRYMDLGHVDNLKKLDDNEKEVIKNSFCSQPFYSLNIWANGDVSPCCTFYGKKLLLGNVYKDKLEDIWRGEKIKKLREEIKNKKFNSICQNCLYYRDRQIVDEQFE